MKSSHPGRLRYGDPEPLRLAQKRLLEIGAAPASVSFLQRTSQAATDAVCNEVLAEVRAFSDTQNPEAVPQLKAHAREHVDEIVRLFEGAPVGEFAFVSAHAQRRAEQHFPLEVTLHSYRCGLRVLSQWMRDAALTTKPRNADAVVSAIVDFAIEYTNLVSTIMTAEYVEHTRMVAAAEGDRRSEMLNLLLNGYDESDGRIARLLRRHGYLDQRLSYCVAVVQSAAPSEMELPERVQRIVAAVSDLLANISPRVMVGVRNALVVAVISERRRQSGWTAPQVDLARRIHDLMLQLGPSVLVGLSADQPSTSSIPRGLQEATIAMELASVANRVVQFTDLPLRSLILHRGGDYARSVVPTWVTALLAADGKSDGALVATLRAMADADLNVQSAGRSLGIHANTVYARLDRIRELSGLDGRRHHDLVEILLAVDCARGN